MIREANVYDRLLILVRRRTKVLVTGDSMLPLLADGDHVVVDTSTPITVGDIVVAYHPYKESVSVVKRVDEILPDGRYVLLGENLSESTDSRHFGTLAPSDIYGKVVALIR